MSKRTIVKPQRTRPAGRPEPGRVYVVRIQHDAWCKLILGKGRCDCAPIVHDPKPVPRPERDN